MLWQAAQQWLAGTPLARDVAGAYFRRRARRHLARLDHAPAARCQARALLGLLHEARNSRFGRDHDFGRVRTPADFRRLVPLRTPAQLWHEYWRLTFPYLGGATWPAPIPYLTPAAAAADGMPPYVPVSPTLLASHRAAALTALALVGHARPHARLFSGRLLFPGGGIPLTPVDDTDGAPRAGSLEAITLHELPPALRPYTLCPLDTNPAAASPDEQLQALADRSARLPVTCIAGEAGGLARFFEHMKRVTRWDHVLHLWPRLTAVLYTRRPGDPGRDRLAADVGELPGRPPVLFLEVCFRPEGAVAVEDPRHGLLRLLADHGVYFEFVPAGRAGSPDAERHDLAAVVPGVTYEVALTSAAGLWACRVGCAVRFESREPPLLRLVGV